MTPEQYIYYGAAFAQLHKNEVFLKYLQLSFLTYMEKKYFG
jgi:hypothetical protein